MDNDNQNPQSQNNSGDNGQPQSFQPPQQPQPAPMNQPPADGQYQPQPPQQPATTQPAPPTDQSQRPPLKIDNNLLVELGLGSLSQPERTALLKHIYETLEMRVGMRLADQMTNEQLDEFETYFNARDDAGAFRWLETNFPNYKDIVADEFNKLKAEVSQNATHILTASQQQAQAAQQMPQQVPQPPQQDNAGYPQPPLQSPVAPPQPNQSFPTPPATQQQPPQYPPPQGSPPPQY